MHDQQTCSRARIPVFSAPVSQPGTAASWAEQPTLHGWLAGPRTAVSGLVGRLAVGWAELIVRRRRWGYRRARLRARLDRRAEKAWRRFESAAVPTSPLWLVGGIVVSLSIALMASRMDPVAGSPVEPMVTAPERGWLCEDHPARSFSSVREGPIRPARCV